MVIRAIWRDLAQALKPASQSVEFCASAYGFLLIAPWVVRDLDERGLQIILLFFLSMWASSLYCGSAVRSGLWLGLAITYKVTPILFVLLLLWKRRFIEAASAIAFCVVFNAVLPGLIWGPSNATEALTRHLSLLQTIAHLEDPSENAIEPATHGNESLNLAILRYLQTYRPGHPLYIDRNYVGPNCTQRKLPESDPNYCPKHPLFVQFLDLRPVVAKWTALAVLAGIAGVLACASWLLAASGSKLPCYSSFAPEWAAASIFVAITAPIALMQHLVLALPATYLVIRDLLTRNDRSWVRLSMLAFIFVSVWILARDPLSPNFAFVVLSYHPHTIALLLLAVLTLTVEGAIKPREVVIDQSTNTAPKDPT